MLNPLAYYYFLLLVLSTIYDSQIYISHSTLLQIPDSYNQQQLYISTSVSNGHCKCNVPRTESKYFPVSLSTSSIRFVAQLTPLFLLNRSIKKINLLPRDLTYKQIFSDRNGSWQQSLTLFSGNFLVLESESEAIQSCLTLCDPMNCSLPGSLVHGISQARILEWVACPSPGDLPNPGIKSMSH